LSAASQEPYRLTKVWMGWGRCRSTNEATGPDARIRKGVISVVSAETATATG
jgi:hypothetical protein